MGLIKKNNKAITLIALVLTIIILLIIVGISISLLTGENSLLKKAKESAFKSEMISLTEEFDLILKSQKVEALLNNGEVPMINAGSLLKDIINAKNSEDAEDDGNSELDGINVESVVELKDILESAKREHNNYVIIVNDILYYVCSTSIEEDEKAKWSMEIGIPIWYNTAVSQTGMNNTNGDYELVNGIYVCTPMVNKSAFNKYNTRYIYIDQNDNLVPGTWINKKPKENWYDYKNKKWANLYVENDGMESYWVWIPRYVFKEAENQTIDAKFVDTDNNYKDPEGNVTTWQELQADGYQLPEAFEFAETTLPGYWISKYQLSEHADTDKYVVHYETVSTMSTIKIQSIETTSANVAKYQYALNGEIMHESTNGEDFTFTGLAIGNKTINVTGLDANGKIVGSYTYYFEVAEVNPPETDVFDQDTTFYVYYDEDGTEHNEIPLSQPAPKNWYDYTTANWANIVTRNNGVESYWVWIPRYQFQTKKERTLVRFIKGTSTEKEAGYEIPEAFTFAGQELTGYWIAKHQLSTETAQFPVNAEMSAGSSLIRILDITGTKIAENQIYQYYLNGVLKHEGTDPKEHFVFEGLETNKTYTVNIIVRNSATHESPNKYIGAVTKKVITTGANAPDISVFDVATTAYVTFDNEGKPIETPFEKGEPDDWYDYSAQKWANIVTKANGKIAYWVWIPRYELRILGDRETLSTANRRVEINFLSGTSTQTTEGYQIPEAFTFAGKELTGYWIAKYQLSN